MILGTVHSKSVGKTTLAVHIASWLDLYGYSVILVDADASQQSSRWLNKVAHHIPTAVIPKADREDKRATMLEKLVPRLGKEYDAVIVDGPAGLGTLPEQYFR